MTRPLKTHWMNRHIQDDTNILKLCVKPPCPDPEPEDEVAYYGVNPHTTYVPTLRFMFRDDYQVSFPYKCISLIEYTAEGGIYLSIARKTVVIIGRNLDELHNWLCAHKVSWIRESTTGYSRDDGMVFIRDIRITKQIG